VHVDGDSRVLQVRRREVVEIALVNRESGAVVGWCVMNIDITELRRAKTALEARERELSLIIETDPSVRLVCADAGSSAAAGIAVLRAIRAHTSSANSQRAAKTCV
jgi:hypothetical protein